MSDTIIPGNVFNLVRADDKDGMSNPSYWIENKDGERISDIHYEGEYQKAKAIFNALEDREQKAEV